MQKTNTTDILKPLALDLFPIIVQLSICHSEKPTNTIFAYMCVSKECLKITQDLFERDADVHDAIIKQLQKIKLVKSVNNFAKTIKFDKHSLFFLWMVNFLKDKNVKLPQELEQSAEKIKNEEDSVLNRLAILTGPFSQSKANKIVTNAFKTQCISEDITFAELVPLLRASLIGNDESIDEYRKNFLYEILLHVIKKTQVSSCSTLIDTISLECGTEYSDERLLNDRSYKLSGIIERFGRLINEKSDKTLKEGYFSLVDQLFEKFWFKHHHPIGFDAGQFINIGIRYIELLPDNLKSTISLYWFLKSIILHSGDLYPTYNKTSEMIESIRRSYPISPGQKINDLQPLITLIRMHNSFTSRQISIFIQLSYKYENILLNNSKDYLDLLKNMLSKLQKNNSVCSSFTSQQMLAFIEFSSKYEHILLNKTKDYLNILETMISKLDTTARKTDFSTKIIPSIELFFKQVIDNCNKTKNNEAKDYELVLNGFLKYLRSLAQ